MIWLNLVSSTKEQLKRAHFIHQSPDISCVICWTAELPTATACQALFLGFVQSLITWNIRSKHYVWPLDFDRCSLDQRMSWYNPHNLENNYHKNPLNQEGTLFKDRKLVMQLKFLKVYRNPAQAQLICQNFEGEVTLHLLKIKSSMQTLKHHVLNQSLRCMCVCPCGWTTMARWLKAYGSVAKDTIEAAKLCWRLLATALIPSVYQVLELALEQNRA